jgi:hypothetical protein
MTEDKQVLKAGVAEDIAIKTDVVYLKIEQVIGWQMSVLAFFLQTHCRIS